MRIEQVRLHNWQSYYGVGEHAVEFDFRGSQSGKKNAIIYGQNTRGKTAFWEAVRFALYGRVRKRSFSADVPQYKPVCALGSSEEPLLNVTAYHNNEFVFGVELWFDLDGDVYHLDRKYQLRPGLVEPRGEADMEEKAVLRNESKGRHEKDVDAFIKSYLPEDLIQFFMFDGERLEEYRDLLLDNNNIELRRNIEDILRLPILNDGIEHFNKLTIECEKEIRKYNRDLSKDETTRKRIDELENNILIHQGVEKKYEDERLVCVAEESTIKQWLSENDQGATAIEQEERYLEEEKRLEKEIEIEKEKIRRILPGTWRAIITERIDISVDRIQADLSRQQEQQKEQHNLEREIEILLREHEGDPCQECKKPRSAPTRKRKEEILELVSQKKGRVHDLEKAKVMPDPIELTSQLSRLMKMRKEQDLGGLLDAEKSIAEKGKAKRIAESKREQASARLTAESRAEVKDKVTRRIALLKSLGVIEERIKGAKAEIQWRQDDLKHLNSTVNSKGEKTIAHKKAEKRKELYQELIVVWSKKLESYRESMRARVEKSASKVFMNCSNNAENYKGLKISSDFTIQILNKNGRPDLGSPGQWSIVAYSMLDSLTECSGIEFPMIIDTPGRSIDNDHLFNVYDHFLNGNRQVIFLPEGSELDPDIGDERYAHLCASTYSLMKDDNDHTTVKLRISNLRKNS